MEHLQLNFVESVLKTNLKTNNTVTRYVFCLSGLFRWVWQLQYSFIHVIPIVAQFTTTIVPRWITVGAVVKISLKAVWASEDQVNGTLVKVRQVSGGAT